jgi:predicted RNase H-like HicB family nuclease
MRKVLIHIDWCGSNYAAAPADEAITCVATGKTLEEVKSNMIDGLQFHLEGLTKNGDPVPDSIQGEWEPVFVLTTRAQLKYSGNFISRKALARETGIAEQQLSHYANGQRHPRPAMQRRIQEGIRAITRHLSLI